MFFLLMLVPFSGAATDTNATVMSWWIFAMVLYPEVQKRGQAEIDAVVGRDRLPTFADFDKLPYIRGMVSAFKSFAIFDSLTTSRLKNV